MKFFIFKSCCEQICSMFSETVRPHWHLTAVFLHFYKTAIT